MAYLENHGSGLHRLIYISRALPSQGPDGEAASSAEIAGIVARAAEKNRALAVTGVLLAYNGWFIQALEGSYDTLKPLYERIATDPRHTDVTLKGVSAAPTRLFSRWAMKQGRKAAPGAGEGFDMAAATADDLLRLLKLATLPALRRAA